MMPSSLLLKGLSEEKVVPLSAAQTGRLPFPLSGIVRLIDATGGTLAIVLSREALEELAEEAEANDPDSLATLEAARRSGRVDRRTIRKKIGL